MRIIYTPAITRKFAEKVSERSGVKIAPYRHLRFSCGELFSKPDESLRGKRVALLGTVNPQTFARDMIRLQIILDGLKRMEIKGIDMILPYFPQPLELMPLFTWVDSLTSVELPPSAYLKDEQKKLLNRPLIDFLKEGKVRDFGKPVTDLDTGRLFAEYFVKLAKGDAFTVLSISKLFPGKSLQQELSRLTPSEFGCANMELMRSKSGKKITGAKVFGDVRDKNIVMRGRVLNSLQAIQIMVETLKAKQAGEISIGVTHNAFSHKVMKELDDNPGVSRVVTTDTIGVPGENFISYGGSEGLRRRGRSSKYVILSTAEIIAKAIVDKTKKGG